MWDARYLELLSLKPSMVPPSTWRLPALPPGCAAPGASDQHGPWGHPRTQRHTSLYSSQVSTETQGDEHRSSGKPRGASSVSFYTVFHNPGLCQNSRPSGLSE